MTCNKHSQKGFSIVEIIVAFAILTISMAVTVPVITRNRWKVDVDSYATQLETGLYSLRAKLGSRKTSCSITFPEKYKFLEPKKITEFSQGVSTTSFSCCALMFVATCGENVSFIAIVVLSSVIGEDCSGAVL